MGTTAPAVYEQIGKVIQDVQHDGKIPFVWRGRSDTSNVKLVYGLDRDGDAGATAINVPAEAETQYQHLVEACHPAGFGVGQKRVYDEDYRQSGFLGSSEYLTTVDPNALGITNEIARVLRPNTPIITKRQKLNIYQKGGKFKTHVDTPQDQRHWGTLVFALPSFFEGGSLTIRHQATQMNCNWSSHSNTSLQWVAFYSDCEHEIEEVLSGFRITVTFDLYDDPHSSPPSALSLGHDLLLSQLQPLLTQVKRSSLQDDGFGFFCSFAYAHNTTRSHTNIAQSLKGIDYVLYECLEQLWGNQIQILPVQVPYQHFASVYDSSTWIEESYDRNFHETREKNENSLIGERLMSLRIWGDEIHNGDFRNLQQLFPAKKRKIYWVNRPQHPELQASFIAYGNDPVQEFIYTDLAIIVLRDEGGNIVKESVEEAQRVGECEEAQRDKVITAGYKINSYEVWNENNNIEFVKRTL